MEKTKRKSGFRYRERVYAQGREIKSPWFQARKLATEWKTNIKIKLRLNPHLYANRNAHKMTFTLFCELWLREIKVKNSRRTHECYSSVVNTHFLPRFGDTPLCKLTKESALDLMQDLLEAHHSPNGINHIIAILKCILASAFNEGYIDQNWCNKIKPLKAMPPKENYWNREDINRFLGCPARDDIFNISLLALNTGLRRGELGALSWRQVDFTQNQIQIQKSRDQFGINENTKTNRKRVVPINSFIKNFLLELKGNQPESELVFKNDLNSPTDLHHLYRSFRLLQEKCGITNIIRFHDLRHTFASHFMMNGGNIYDLQKILGHSKLSMTEKYAHLSPDHLQKASSIVSFGF
jgi:integrase